MSLRTWAHVLEEQHRWWQRAQPMGDWDENTFQVKGSKLQQEKTLSEQAVRIQCPGKLNFPRFETSTFEYSDKCNCTVCQERWFREKQGVIHRPTGRHDG